MAHPRDGLAQIAELGTIAVLGVSVRATTCVSNGPAYRATGGGSPAPAPVPAFASAASSRGEPVDDGTFPHAVAATATATATSATPSTRTVDGFFMDPQAWTGPEAASLDSTAHPGKNRP